MNWWSWMIGGALLLGAELGLVNAQFYLVFIGAAALAVGLASVALPVLSPSMQWALFAIVATASMLLFRAPLYQRLHRPSATLVPGPPGGVLTLPRALDPGQSCQVEHGGTFWNVCNHGALPIAAHTRARIVSVQGLTLLVQPDA
jgi:membrane protein implicated in regulation of membrane protease activity